MREIMGRVILEGLEEIADPKHTAFVVIDVQNDSFSPKGFVGSRGGDISWQREVVSRIKMVLEEARQLGILTIFTIMVGSKDAKLETAPGLVKKERSVRLWMDHLKIPEESVSHLAMYAEGTWGADVLDELEPRPNERVIVKYRSSAFLGTPLDFIFKNMNIKSAVVVGSVTQGCVETTVRDLEQYGYYPVVLSDCVCSSRRDLHDAALLVMSVRYDVVTSEELLKVWRNDPRNY